MGKHWKLHPEKLDKIEQAKKEAKNEKPKCKKCGDTMHWTGSAYLCNFCGFRQTARVSR